MIERFGLRGGAALALVAAGAAAVLTGCTSAASQNPVAAQSGAAGAGAPSSATSAASAQGAAAGTRECTLADLTISVGAPLPSGLVPLPAGETDVSQRALVFKDTGSAACFVVGWPGVSVLASGGALAYNSTRVLAKGPAITLQPGDSASALLGTIAPKTAAGSSAPACPTMPNLLVTPPDETHSAHVAFGEAVCQAPTIMSLAAGVDGGDSAQAASHFSEARQQWMAGATAISAQMGSYWTQAANLLTTAAESGTGAAGFPQAAQELTQLTEMPDAGLTQAQQTQEATLVGELNVFFNTPGLYN